MVATTDTITTHQRYHQNGLEMIYASRAHSYVLFLFFFLFYFSSNILRIALTHHRHQITTEVVRI